LAGGNGVSERVRVFFLPALRKNFAVCLQNLNVIARPSSYPCIFATSVAAWNEGFLEMQKGEYRDQPPWPGTMERGIDIPFLREQGEGYMHTGKFYERGGFPEKPFS